MKSTVDRPPLHDLRSNQRELANLVNQMRDRHNRRYVAFNIGRTSATGLWTDIISLVQPNDTSWTLRAMVTARAAAGGAARATIERVATFYREATAGPVQEGATTDIVVQRNVAGLDCRFNVTGNAVALQVTDDAVRTVDWVVELWQQEAKAL